MKRFILGWLVVTLLALAYVHQRLSLITLGYEVEAMNVDRDDLLDQHRVLNYNVLALRSPVILDERLAKRDVQLTPPQVIEILPFSSQLNPVSGLNLEPSSPERAWWQQALHAGDRFFGGDRLAVAQPAGDKSS